MGMNYQLDATVCDLCRMDNLDDDCAHCELVPFSPKRESDTYYEDGMEKEYYFPDWE